MNTAREFDLVGSFSENDESIGSETISTYPTLEKAQAAARMYWERRKDHFVKELTNLWITDETGEIVDGG